MAFDHKGIVTCRGIYVENKVYRRGEKLEPEHESMLLNLFRNILDQVDTNGWISVSGANINVVLFSSCEPFWISN